MKYYYTYIISSPQIKAFYISYTGDLKKELGLHNNGKISETSNNKPWKLTWYTAFLSEDRARRFAEFLNSNEGKIFRQKWIIDLDKSSKNITSLRRISSSSPTDPTIYGRPANSKTCPICGGGGKAANDMYFNRFGHRQSGKPTLCLTCMGKGWIDSNKKVAPAEY